MKELGPIRVFLEVAAQRSFSGAARSLRLTPASVTRIIAGLEADLGQQLLVRTTRQVSLTSAGALVAERYQPIVAEFDRVTELIHRAARPDQGRLSINAPLSLGQRVLPGLIGAFRLAYPNIALDVQMTDRLVDIVEGEADLAVRISAPPRDKSTIWRKICEVPRHVIAAPSLFERVRRPERPDELETDLCLSYGMAGSAENWTFVKGSEQRVVRAGNRIVSNNGDVLYGLAAGGHGIVNLPAFLVQEGLASGAVEAILSDWQIPPLYLMLYYPPYEVLPPLVATFTDFFEAFINDLDGFEV